MLRDKDLEFANINYVSFEQNNQRQLSVEDTLGHSTPHSQSFCNPKTHHDNLADCRITVQRGWRGDDAEDIIQRNVLLKQKNL